MRSATNTTRGAATRDTPARNGDGAGGDGAADAAAGWRGSDVERYEQLRARILGGDLGGFRLGLGVLQHRGVAGWLRAWGDPVAATTTTDPTARAAGPPTHPARAGTSPTAPAASPGGPAAEELVGVLAGMALACLGRG